MEIKQIQKLLQRKKHFCKYKECKPLCPLALCDKTLEVCNHCQDFKVDKAYVIELFNRLFIADKTKESDWVLETLDLSGKALVVSTISFARVKTKSLKEQK